ncbi:peptide MFS transporter [Pseudomaricurvus sp. HS19]|uniref:peptide MFS transporter n=1 Tax=Pseudomaricurvus sp. HS19 TaxID=2692626 RepID=UPI0013684F25|nr:peptide MFS transporter [Pseudomaricurvus sp. HS19]MYM64117.1 MFS transporter [Pseudomaricurvus sp. HS19]
MTNASIPAHPLHRDDLFGHPKGLYVCFTTEMWERFSFYGMKFLLLLYLTKYHLFTDAAAYNVLGAYAGLVYALPVIGGAVADRWLGMRKAVVFGGLLLSAGHLLMAWEGQAAQLYSAGTLLNADLQLNDGTLLAAGTLLQNDVVIQDVAGLKIFFLALALIAVGVGFLKPNISTIVGQLYGKDDPRRDSGFTIFYMGINLGAFVAILLCGWLGETFGWGYGFGAAGVGMLAGLISFLHGQKYLRGLAEPRDPEMLRRPVAGPLTRESAIYLGGLLFLGLVWLLVQNKDVVLNIQQLLLLLALSGLPLYALLKGSREDLHRTLVLMVLIASSVVFWSLFEQSAGSMTLFADRVVDRSLGDGEVRASMFGSLNPLFIITLAPLLASLWIWLSRRGLEPSVPVKFGLGIIQAGLGFGALVMGISMAGEDGRVAMVWLMLAYLLHTTGELCLSPVGLSAVTKLSIPRVVGVSMGTWFLATALSQIVATNMGKLAAIDSRGTEAENLSAALSSYAQLYEYLMWAGLAIGVLLLLLSPLLRRGMHGTR